jgi:hypothetical protein
MGTGFETLLNEIQNLLSELRIGERKSLWVDVGHVESNFLGLMRIIIRFKGFTAKTLDSGSPFEEEEN